MSVYIRGLLGLLLASMTQDAIASQGRWETVIERSGIHVSERWDKSKALPAFRGQVTLDSDIWSILSILQDTPRSHEWVHRCMESRQLERHGLTHYVIYNRTDAPWPFQDRDVVVASTVTIPEGANEIFIRIESTDHPAAPTPDDTTRMPYLLGHYRLKMLTPLTTWVEYQIDADPGGDLPRWLIRLATKDLPFKTLDGLRSRVATVAQEERYKTIAAQFRALYHERTRDKSEATSVSIAVH